MNLHPYQVEGAAFLAGGGHSPHRGCADEPGLGKTAEAIRAAELLGADVMRIVCPAVAQTNWRREISKWWGGKFYLPHQIASYDMARTADIRETWTKTYGKCVMVLDEAHYLKTPSAKRTKAIYGSRLGLTGLAGLADNVILLTGTPTPNNCSEHYTHLKALWPELIPAGTGKAMTFEEFCEHYTVQRETPYGPKIVGQKNESELQAILRKVWIRRKVVDVLPDLPPWVWTSVPIDAPSVYAEIKALESEVPEIQQMQRLMGEGMDLLVANLDAPNMARLRHAIGTAKAPVVANIVSEELVCGAYNKIVLFAHHRAVLDTLGYFLAGFNPARLDGSMSLKQKDAAQEKFDKDPTCRVFLAQMDAARENISLTAANHAAFVEASWVPGHMMQNAKRIHRIGQLLPCFVRIFALARSVDDLLASAFVRKQQFQEGIEI